MLFGGFYVAIERVPRWIRWLKYTSYLYWSYTGMLSNQFAGQLLPCEAADHPLEFGGCPFAGDEVVRGRGAGKFSVGTSIGMLVSFTAFFRTLAYVVRRRPGEARRRRNRRNHRVGRLATAVTTVTAAGRRLSQSSSPEAALCRLRGLLR